MTTPYTPQGNGIVERFMGYLKNALITLIDGHPKTWDDHLPAILFAYRATPHPELGDTPFFLNKGYDPWLPEMLALDISADKCIRDGTWLEELTKARETLKEKIAEQQAKAQAECGAYAHARLEPGQLVLTKRTPAEVQVAHTKLADKYDHPARIIQIMPNGVAYQVIYIDSGERAIVNQRRLRRFYTEAEDDTSIFPTARTTSLPLAPLR